MSVSVPQAFYDTMKSMDPAELVESLSDDVVIVGPSSFIYGGTTTTHDAFFEKVLACTNRRAPFRIETSEVFGDGERLAGHFTATFAAHGSRETFLLKAELYAVTNGAISKEEVFQHDPAG